MNLNLENKVAIVTGASAGLGKAIASGLAHEGVSVAISARDQSELEQTAAEIESVTESDVLAITGDMSNPDSVNNLVDRVIAEFTSVHILVNNVGQATRDLFTRIDIEKIQSSFELNLMSAIEYDI